MLKEMPVKIVDRVQAFPPPPTQSKKDEPNIASHRCQICGEVEKLRWTKETNERLISHQICFKCDLWAKTVEQDMINPLWYGKLIIDGIRYTAKPLANCEANDKPVVLLENLTTRERQPCCNLKIVAVVPDHFRSQFPDNARIVTDDPEYPLVDGDC